MKLFWRGGDYNLILEKILDSKNFSPNSKSLLLSMTYKIEEFYEDYQKVKNIDTTKDEFLNLILDIIKSYCNSIELIEPKNAKIMKENNVLAVTNEKEKSVLCYPTEVSLLYALSDVMPKYFLISDSFEYKDALQRTLSNGYNMNIVEILSDFSGWSWDINIKNKKYYQDSLIYQNLVILFGNSFLEEWKSKKEYSEIDYFNEVKKFFANTKYFEFLCKYLVFCLTNKEKAIKNKELDSKIKELEKISDKMMYFEKIKNSKLRYLKELEKITLVLNNKELLRKEYIAKNSKLPQEKRIPTIGTFKKMIENRKAKIVVEIANLSSKMNPTNYLNYKNEIEKFIEINTREVGDKDEIFICMQEEFIKAISDICFETEDIDSLKNLLFKLRYYRFLYITKDKQIKDIPDLNNEIFTVIKQVIQKLIQNEKIRIIANNMSLNQEIISNILDTRVMDLDNLRFEIDIGKDSFKIKSYDKEVFEKEYEIDGTFSKKNFYVKPKKIYKLFN